jgi:acetylornithine deacetylase/succinyl-diaminopimelate desuccinylase-like protein
MTAVADDRRSITTLREVVGWLAPIVRGPGSAGEAEAAAWLGERLRAAGADEVKVEPATYRPGFAPLIAGLCGTATALGVAALRRDRAARPLAAAGGLLTAAAIADDCSNGPRVMRRLLTRPQRTQNVVARIGDPDAPQTLVVLAHHDAAATGFIFDQRLSYAVAERFPGLIARTDTAPPMWLAVMSGPVLIGLGSLLGSRWLTRAGVALGGFATAAVGDIARGRVVPGANDNLSACAVLVAAAERLKEQPIDGVRVLLVSCGAEEVCQGGIYSFLEDHRDELPRDSTKVLNIDTVGSPNLVMLEGEGPVVMEDYPDPSFRDRVSAAAERAGVTLRRGARATSSTDSVVMARAGYAVTTLVSFDYAKQLSNYHQMTDTAENLNYETVAEALEVTLALAADLAQDRD